jgi:hypothetical protein
LENERASQNLTRLPYVARIKENGSVGTDR